MHKINKLLRDLKIVQEPIHVDDKESSIRI